METIITLDLTTWAFLGGTIVPILVGLVTKLNAPSALRGLINLILSAVAGLIAVAITQDGVLDKASIVAGFMALVASVGTYYGVLKPMGITGAVQRATANFGLGTGRAHSTEEIVRTRTR